MASADLLAVLSEAVESLGARRAELHEPVADRAVDVVVQVASEADHAALDRPNRSANRQVSPMPLIAPAEGSTSSATSSETLAAMVAELRKRMLAGALARVPSRRARAAPTLPLYHPHRWARVGGRADARMLSKISPKRPSLFGTGWSRVNLAVDCPTSVHCDANIGVTAVFAADVSPPTVTRRAETTCRSLPPTTTTTTAATNAAKPRAAGREVQPLCL
jgi:hypothetical protein